MKSIHELERSNGDFPREHQYATLESLEQTPDNPELEVFFNAAEKLVTHWRGDKFAGLYLYGEPGTGKTHGAIGLARELHAEGASIHYRHVPSWKPRERVQDSGFGGGRQVERIAPHITDWMGTAYNHESDRKPFVTAHSQLTGPNQPAHEKSVLLLDDYKPFAREYVASAVEAASQYGALVIVTSNYTDPFKILEETPEEQRQSAFMEGLSEAMPSISGLVNVEQKEMAAKRDALRSRVAAAFKFIHFEGKDRRIDTSFWND